MSKEGTYIKQRIDANNALIEKNLFVNTFTLNNIVADILVENKKLQEKCPHEFDEDGFCIYCYKMKED